MKRVQALVTGKKKQCTKLPKPAVKEKSSSLPEASSPSQSPNWDTDKRAKEDVHGDSFAISTTGSTSSASSTITAGSSSSASTIGASSSRKSSKIPGTSPKKSSKDGNGGISPKKVHPRADSHSVSKSESVKKKATKEKQKSKNVNDSGGHAMVTEESGSKTQQKSANLDEPGYFGQNHYADESQDLAKHDQVSKDVKPTSPSSEAPLQVATGTRPTQTRMEEQTTSKDPSSSTPELRHKNVQAPSSSEQKLMLENAKAAQPQVQQPLHGILKDSNSSGSNNKSHYQNGPDHHYNGTNAQQRENSYDPNSQTPQRSASMRSNPGPGYQQVYGTLPRNSRSTTPTPENAYNYGSFPRRSNVSTPTQPKMFYNGSQEWGLLSHKAESDSGFFVGKSNYATVNSSRGDHGVAGYSNDNYAVVNQNNKRNDSQGSRSGGAATQYYSDTETGRHRGDNGGYSRGLRAGSVPWGYESDSGAYGMMVHGQPRFGSIPRNFEGRAEYGSGSSSSLRVQPGDEQYRAVPGKRPIPRRHTLGSSSNRMDAKELETERKREAFMQLLAHRYPQYADRIQGVGSSTPHAQLPDKPFRSREGQRRRQALVAYNQHVAGHSLDYEDPSTMNDLEISTFQRGGFSRASLPVVRSASTSLERPLGLVFLVYGDQTKKSLLPNEITSLDTVRALFVRAFPDLTLEILENPRKKIYLLDPATNIYFQLEDLGDIKDRSVLKLHETDNEQPQKVKEKQEVRGRTVQMPVARSYSFQTYSDVPVTHNEMVIKPQSLPPQNAKNYQDVIQDQRNHYELERRSRSRTPEPAERSQRSLSAGPATKQRFSHSPDRQPTPERAHLNPIPENRQIPLGYVEQGNYYETVGPGTYRGHHPSGIYDSIVPYQGYPSASPIPAQQTYVACSTRTPVMAYPQRAIQPGMDMRDSARGINSGRHFNPTDAGFQRSQSYRVAPAERDGKDVSRSHSVTPTDDTARNRIEKMEQQLANLTAWVHYQKDGTRREVIPAPRSLGRATSDSSDTFPASSASKHKGETTPISTIVTSTNHVVHSQGLSDADNDACCSKRSSGLSSRESTPLSAQAEICTKLAQLKSDLHVLRRQQQLNMEAMNNEFVATSAKIKKVLSSLPEAENLPNFQKRTQAAITKSTYVNDKERVDKDLGDIEASIEELRTDVISKQCRVNTADIDGIALILTSVTKSLADLKARFIDIHSQMNHVLHAERKILMSEERFLKEEPIQIENSLKRCKNISQSLSYLQGLTSEQHERPSGVSSAVTTAETSLCGQNNVSVHKTEALVSQQKHRVHEREVTDASSERKEKASSQWETVRLGKTSEMVSKNLQKLYSTDGGKVETDKKGAIGLRGQSSQEKPLTPSKSAVSSTATSTSISMAATVQRSSAATVSSVSSVSVASIVSVKPSVSVTSTLAKTSEKPTATVSAMTAGVSETVTATVIKAEEKESSPPSMKNVFMPLTPTTEHITNTVLGVTDPVTHPAKEETKSPKKRDTTVYTYKVCGPVNPVFPIPPVFSKPENYDRTATSKTLSTEQEDKNISLQSDKFKLESSSRDRPSDLSISRTDSVKKGSVSFSDPPVTMRADNSSPNTVNGHSFEKVDTTAQKQTARNAFFSSLNSSPNSPHRNSANLDPGPVLSPLGVTGKMTHGPTINLVLTGSASPMSPTSPGSFNISPPIEMNILRSVDNKTSSSTKNFPANDIPQSDHVNSPYDSQLSTNSDSCSKQKKIPPPPPPRQGSRPSSANISPLNGMSSDLSKEMPRFVGGILGQHRLSGGPLSSTPKAAVQQDNGSSNYINKQQPNEQSQKHSQRSTSTGGEGLAVPSSSPLKINLDCNERGSSSESSSSSSGNMGSQQSVVSVIRSSSLSVKDSKKSKPDPPRRHSSLLAKLTGHKESKSKINNGKAKVNGVDF